MEGQDMVVGGFAFTDKKAALKARHEAESIQYLEKQINMENPRMVLEFYKKLLAEEVFETPVGLAFLKGLYDFLAKIPEFQDGLAPIQTEKMATALLGGAPTGAGAPPGAEGQESFQRAEEMAALYEDKLNKVKQKMRSAELKQKRTEEGMRKQKSSLRFSRLLNVFFLLVVIGMFALALTDNHPNIINYENKIQDKYSQWEMDLQEREEKVREKERGQKGE
ncbi:MAG: hypothetical protein HFH38_06890 [Lachnospiraceae bacterium]|jgi:hypothetical protein|nr:hypothetical protein [Lachnospiraceae bacterium]